MLSAIRDLVSAVAIAMVFAFSNGQQKWIWSQLAQLRQQILKAVSYTHLDVYKRQHQEP